MKSVLADNIRTLRKEKGLTQEKLAEVLGVTVGAVHKWEAGLSTPELQLLMGMADFFDLTLDVLVGFELKDNKISSVSDRLRKMRDSQDEDALAEAEKALKKYPHSFEIVLGSARVYSTFGMVGKSDKKLLRRSLELFDEALKLLPLNADTTVDESTIYGEISQVYIAMGQNKKGIELFRKYNSGGRYNERLCYCLSMEKDTEDADRYLSYSILSQGDKRFHMVCAAALLFAKKGRYEDAIDILNWGIETDEIFRSGDKINFFDRLHCYYMAAIAHAKLKLKDKKGAEEMLIKARDLAVKFDKDPDLDGKNLRFVELDESCKVVDSSGETALESVGEVIALLEDKELMKLWQKITE